MSRPRGPGIAYGVVALVLIIVVALVTMSTNQPPPPAIAEFAPQAQDTIADAPDDQAGRIGRAAGTLTPSPDPSRAPGEASAPIDAPRVRKCVGDPPRQIEDPQSPPCVPYWAGENGGVTHRGVTRDTVRVGLPTGDSAEGQIYEPLTQFFNRRFEFYGRRLLLVPGGQYPTAGTNDSAAMRAAAVEMDEQHKVFASLRYRTGQGFAYHEELAKRRVLSVTGVEWGYETVHLRERAPYLWQYMVESDVLQRAFGEWTCATLAGKPARFSGEATLQTATRAFGVILQNYYDDDDTTSDALVHTLTACGQKPRLVLRNPVRSANQASGNDAGSATNAIVQMRRAGVTSILCLCTPYAFGTMTKAATSQAHLPEWLLSSFGAFDTIWGMRLGSAQDEQTDHAFGIGFAPREVKITDQPYMWAWKEGDPAAVTTSESQGAAAIHRFAYEQMLLLASGIQLAGPRLTPDSFATGMHRARFPNPAHRNNAGRVGFAPNRYAMTSEALEWWWSNADVSPYTSTPGDALCYPERDVRRASGAWPESSDDRFFRRPCDSGG